MSETGSSLPASPDEDATGEDPALLQLRAMQLPPLTEGAHASAAATLAGLEIPPFPPLSLIVHDPFERWAMIKEWVRQMKEKDHELLVCLSCLFIEPF